MRKTIAVKEDNAMPVLNALKHGILSRHLLLASEDTGEYIAMLEALQQEHAPQGVTEHHLVEELVGIIWRKRRLRIAEVAHYQKALKPDSGYNHIALAALATISTTTNAKEFDLKKALACGEEENREELKEIAEYRELAIRVRKMLEDGTTYEDALSELAEVTKEWWQDALKGKEIESWEKYQPEAASLAKFLDKHVLPFYMQQYEDVIYRPLVKRQAEGEAFIPNDRLEKFSRYEVHLDRKFERALTVLIRLQDIRKGKTPEPAKGQVA